MKFIRRDYTAFVGIPSTRAEIQDYMCSEIADMIVSSETGWEYDTRTPNKTAFISLPNGGGTSTYPQTRYPVLYLRNSVSGAKMAVTSIYMNIYTSMTSSDVRKFYPVTQAIFQKAIGTSTYQQSGICIAMIPPGSEDEFPDEYSSSTTFGASTLPFMCEFSGATEESSSNTFQYINGAMGSLCYSGSGTICSYGVLIDQYSVILFSGIASSSRGALSLSFGIGKLLGTLSYDTEQSMQYYAGLQFSDLGQGNYGRFLTESKNGFSYYGLGPYSTGDSGVVRISPYAAQTFNQSGELIKCYYSLIGNELFSTAITNSQSPDFVRWQPGIVFSKTSDTMPIYEGGDNFKGYLDTNLIRYAIANKGQLFNNGQFCCVADNLLMKWDPDAEDTINA